MPTLGPTRLRACGETATTTSTHSNNTSIATAPASSRSSCTCRRDEQKRRFLDRLDDTTPTRTGSSHRVISPNANIGTNTRSRTRKPSPPPPPRGHPVSTSMPRAGTLDVLCCCGPDCLWCGYHRERTACFTVLRTFRAGSKALPETVSMRLSRADDGARAQGDRHVPE
jgi:hypothetical protein